MNKLTKIAIVAAGLALAAQGAFAAGNGDALVLSINNNDGGGTTEFDVNLGTVASLKTAGANDDLSGLISSFNTSFSSATASGLNIGAVGGQNGQGGVLNQGVGNNLFVTTLRAGGGSYTTAGTEAAPSPTPNASTIASAGGLALGYSDFGANNAVSGSGSFSSIVAFDPANGGTANPSWVSDLGGDNPLQKITGSTITLDVWGDTQTTKGTSGATTGWVYEGDLTFTYSPSGAPATLIWDAAVPEPTTYGLFAGVGLLALSLRRQLIRKNA